MNDAEFVMQQARVQKYLDKWLKPIGLGYWDLTFKWFRGGIPDASSTEVIGLTSVDWRYLHGSISFNLVEVAKCTDEFLERLVVHELVHVITKELQVIDDGWQAHWERVTEMLAKAFLWTNELVPAPIKGEVEN